jgi:hypothetical protein
MTEAAADDLPSWHDNLIYGLRFDPPDPDREDWRSDLIFDIDYIVEWICGTDGGVTFRIAPATLVFHDVTDLSIAVDYGGGGYPQTLNELSIASITREPIRREGAAGPLPYYRWTMALNLPTDGEIAFGASGYTQTLRAEPTLHKEQRLPKGDRPHLLAP